MKTIINVGARYNRAHPERKGGVVVLVEQWLKFCANEEQSGRLRCITIDSNKHNYQSMIRGYFSVMGQIRRALRDNPGTDTVLMLHGTEFDYLYIAPFVQRMAQRVGAKFVMRKFAGSFREDLAAKPKFIQNVVKKVLRKADMLIWEPKKLVEWGRQFNECCLWFPNPREATSEKRHTGPYRRKFVFLSRVEKNKGIPELMEAFRQLGSECTLDIYGPIFDDTKPETLNGENYHYRGLVAPDRVASTLTAYDAMILPTKWRTEGYPGVVTEAFAVGLPVIASRIGGIPEMIQEGQNGLLVEPGDVLGLVAAIRSIDEVFFQSLASGAAASFATYDASSVNPHILEEILKL